MLSIRRKAFILQRNGKKIEKHSKGFRKNEGFELSGNFILVNLPKRFSFGRKAQ